MRRTVHLPPLTAAHGTLAHVEAVPGDGPSLTPLVESAACSGAGFHVRHAAAIARAKTALHAADCGVGLMTVEDFLTGMQQRAQMAQDRLHAAVGSRNTRGTGTSSRNS